MLCRPTVANTCIFSSWLTTYKKNKSGSKDFGCIRLGMLLQLLSTNYHMRLGIFTRKIRLECHLNFRLNDTDQSKVRRSAKLPSSQDVLHSEANHCCWYRKFLPIFGNDCVQFFEYIIWNMYVKKYLEIACLHGLPQLSNLWWIPNWVSKGFGHVVRVGSSRRMLTWNLLCNVGLGV